MVVINDKEYSEDDLTDEQKYFVSQLQDIGNKQQNLQFQLDQLNAAKSAFQNALIESLERAEDAA